MRSASVSKSVLGIENMANRITNYTWLDPQRRIERAQEIFDFCSAIIRIHGESGEPDGTELHVMRLTQAAAGELLQQENRSQTSV
jgi:hypothetical protein